MTGRQAYELIEFRNYRVAAGATDLFADHFEAHYLASQEAFGMHILGQFRVVDEPDRFMWVRAFPRAADRGAALAAFYSGAVWTRTQERANELMSEWHDVLLLKPSPTGPVFDPRHVPHGKRPAAGLSLPTASVAMTLIVKLDPMAVDIPPAMQAVFDRVVREHDVAERGRFVTAHLANDFPQLPVQEDVHVALLLMSAREPGALVSFAGDLAERVGRVSTRHLEPTLRSTLR